LAGSPRADLSEETRRRFQRQDVDALAAVYDRYARPVWSVAMSITHAEHLAQEAVQDTFLRAWRAAGSYDPRLALGPWLLTIARHATLDLVRREFRPRAAGTRRSRTPSSRTRASTRCGRPGRSRRHWPS
jgi:RNA polymerase sigma factor (sigma-70 family)